MKKENKRNYFLIFILVLFSFILVYFFIFLKLPSYIKNQESVSQDKNSINHSDLGISIGTNIFNLSQDDLEKQFSDMSESGFKWIRFDFDWSLIQPSSPNSFTYSSLDRVVDVAYKYKINILGIIDNTPAWAREDGCYNLHCPPKNMSDFSVFVDFLVARYSQKNVHVWEIWNEPNLVTFWGQKPNVEKYTEVLSTAYKTIKTKDNNSIVLTGGIGVADVSKGDIKPLDFIEALYKNGAKDYFDAIGFHPYTYPLLPSSDTYQNSWLQISYLDESILNIMKNNSDESKQIWITEYGAPTDGPVSVSEDFQSRSILEAYKINKSYSFSGPIFIYSYKDLGVNKNNNENFFGIIKNDGTPKQAYLNIRNLAK